MKQSLFSIAFVFVLLLSGSFSVARAQEVEWMTFTEAVEANEKEPRKILIDCYTDWCGWCKRMDKNTFENGDIAEYLGEKYYAVKLNAEQKEDIVFKGKTYKFVAQGRRGYHELAAALMGGKMSYPTIVYMNEDLQVLQPISGYKAPKDIDPILKYWGENAYMDTTWADFMTTYQSPFEGSAP